MAPEATVKRLRTALCLIEGMAQDVQNSPLPVPQETRDYCRAMRGIAKRALDGEDDHGA